MAQAGGKDVKLQKSGDNSYDIRFMTDESQDVGQVREEIQKQLEAAYGKDVCGTAVEASFRYRKRCRQPRACNRRFLDGGFGGGMYACIYFTAL